MSVTFLAPAWLWMLFALPLVALARTRVRIARHALVRAAVFACLILALARPAFWTDGAQEHAVVVVDASASRNDRSATLVADLRRAVGRWGSDTKTTLVTIGPRAFVDDALENAFAHVVRIDSERSPIGAGLAAAARAIPDSERGSVWMLTDGRATHRHFGDALIALEERGLPLYVSMLGVSPHPARVASLQPTGTVRVGESVGLALELVGDDGPARVEVASPDGPIAMADTFVQDGAGHAIVEWEPREAGFVTLTARVGEHELKTTVAVSQPLRALYVGERVTGSAQQLARLLGPGIALESFVPSDGAQSPDLDGFDLAVLDDVPADAIGGAQATALATAVRDRGLGLVVAGGEASFGPGGYRESALADLLPVECVQKEEKRDPSTTLVLIVDTSGSMGGERIQLAKEVARLAMARLLPHDKVGIVEFYGAKRWAAPIQPASNAIDLARALNRMDSGGGTVIMPAIEEAFYGLQNVQTRYKHVLVLTDGGVENGAFEPLLRRMSDEGITTSTVLIGPEAHSEFLVDLANWGKGRFYSVPDRFNLPEVLFKQPTSSRLPAYKPGHFAVVTHGGPGFWGGVARADVPAIAGYVETAAKPGAETLIEIEGEGDPVLSTWVCGLGRVTAFTSELTGPGTESWRAWTGFGPLLARVFARTADEHRPPFTFALEREGPALMLTARRTRPGSWRPHAERIDTDASVLATLAFDERADGVFVARFVAPPDVEVRMRAGVEGDARARDVPLVSNRRGDEVDELAVAPHRAIDLGRLARATGGDTVDDSMLASFEPRAGGPAATKRLRELAPWLFGLALLAYLFDVFHRRRDARAATVRA